METQAFFDIVVGVLQGDAVVHIICIDFVVRTSIDLMKENSFTLAKARSRWYLAQTITDADYADDIVLLVNTPTQAESLLHSQERAVNDINLHVNIDKIEFIYFNKWDDISTLNVGSLKLVDKFIFPWK